MELALFFIALVGVGLGTFWLLGLTCGLIRTPAVYFPLSLAAKMTGAAFAGAILLGFGGIIAATAVFVYEFKKRDDFVMWKSVMIGGWISFAGSAATLVAAYALAWQILD